MTADPYESQKVNVWNQGGEYPYFPTRLVEWPDYCAALERIPEPVLDLLERCSAWIHDDRRWHHEGLGPVTPAEIEEDLKALLREHGRLK